MRGASRCGVARGTGSAALGALLVALAWLGCGCSSREAIHPGLRVDQQEFDRAVERGRSLVASGADPYQAYGGCTQSVNQRLSGNVILREVSCGWPAQEIAFAIAKQGKSDDTAVQMTAREARRRAEKEIKFSAILQLPKDYDVSRLSFSMRSSLGQIYPPIAVEQPIYLRDVSSALDPSMPPSALYAFEVRFPIQGSPGYPAIGPEVTSLQLVVQEGESAITSPPFLMPTMYRRR